MLKHAAKRVNDISRFFSNQIPLIRHTKHKVCQNNYHNKTRLFLMNLQLGFNKSTYFENILRVEKYESLQKLKELREPVKKGE